MNKMCIDCTAKDCKGTNNEVWTGCIFKKGKTSSIVPIKAKDKNVPKE